MKILYISNGYPPHRWAGTEIYTAGLAKGFQGRGHDVAVLCAGEWDHGSKHWNGCSDDLSGGVPVRRIHLNWEQAPDPFRYLHDNPVVAEFLGRYLGWLRPELVHVTSCETLSASVLRVAREMGVPIVLSLTDFWFLCPRINLLRSDGSNCDGFTSAWDCLRCQLRGAKVYRWSRSLLPKALVARLLSSISRHPLLTRQRGLRGMAGEMEKRRTFLRRALNWPDCRLTASGFVRRVYEANGISAPIRVQAYGHDLDWLRAYRGKTPSEPVRIGYIGQIIPSKGVHVLLQAARSLQPELGSRFELLVYGDLRKAPEYGAQILALAAGLPNTRFPGLYSHEDSAAVFSGIDVLVVPSLWFDFPLVIHEAFATATPVIASNLGSMNETVEHGVNGLCFVPGDSADLAGQLRRIIEDKGLRRKLQAAVPEVKTIAEEINELECIYTGLSARKISRSANI